MSFFLRTLPERDLGTRRRFVVVATGLSFLCILLVWFLLPSREERAQEGEEGDRAITAPSSSPELRERTVPEVSFLEETLPEEASVLPLPSSASPVPSFLEPTL